MRGCAIIKWCYGWKFWERHAATSLRDEAKNGAGGLATRAG
jgi:hypothetical protein